MGILRISEKIILTSMFVLCLLAMVYSTPDPALSIRNIVLAVGTFLLLISVMTRVSVGDVQLTALRHPIAILYWLFFATIVISGLNAVNRSEWLYEVLRAFLFGVLLILIPVILTERTIIKIMACLSFVRGMWGLVQVVVLLWTAGSIVRNRYTGSMCNMNLWASAFMLLMPFAWYAAVKYRKGWAIMGAIACMSGVMNIFLIMSRSVIAGLMAACLTTGIFKRKVLLLLLVVVVIMAGFAAGFSERFFNSGSMTHRVNVWKASLEMFAEHNPVTGVGAGNWKLMLGKYSRHIKREDAFVRVYYRQPHNDLVWVLCEMGFVGLMVYLSLFTAIIYYSIKTRNLLVLAVLAAYLVDANFSFPRERAFHSLVFIVLASLTIMRSAPVKLKMHPMLVVPAAVAASLIVALAIVDMGFRHDSAARIKKIRSGEVPYKKVLAESEGFNWFTTVDLTTVPVYWYAGLANYLAGNIEQSVYDFRRSIKANPNHPYVLNGLGAALAKTGDIRQAQVYIDRAVKICPRYKEAVDNQKMLKELKEGL